MQQAVARGVQAAGENENGGGAAMAFMGMGMNAAGGMMQGVAQPATNQPNPFINVGQAQPSTQPVQPTQTSAQPAQEDPYAKLTELKKLLDNGVITAEDFEAAKKKLLGI